MQILPILGKPYFLHVKLVIVVYGFWVGRPFLGFRIQDTIENILVVLVAYFPLGLVGSGLGARDN